VTISAGDRRATCAWCGAGFESARRRGPAPDYCRRSHRQRAYEARRIRPGGANHDLRAPAGADLETLGATLAETRQAVTASPASLRVVREAYQRLAAVVATTLGALPAPGAVEPATVTDITALAQRPRRQTPKPWKVTFHPSGADPAAGEVISAHTTEAAAQGAARRYLEAWALRQIRAERARWGYSVVADPVDGLEGGFERTQAKARAARLVVRAQGDESHTVYRRHPDPRRPGRIEVLRTDRILTETLAVRWHAGPDAYTPLRFGDVDQAHPYVTDLLQDACGLAYLATADGPRQKGELWDAVPAFLNEVLEGLGETYELTAAEILEWLEGRGVVALVPAGRG
jgi:hypothetical protein